MRHFCFPLSCLFLLTSLAVQAQVKKTAPTSKSTQASNTPSATPGKKTPQQTFDENVPSVAETKKSLDSLFWIFKPKTPNEVTVAISGIEYDNADFEKLVGAIKDVKGVKKVATGYTDHVATITLFLKASASTDFWKTLPAETRAHFKINNLTPDQIVAEYLDPKKELTNNK